MCGTEARVSDRRVTRGEEPQQEARYARGWLDAAESLEQPYPESVFQPMTAVEVKVAVSAMNAVVRHASKRMHAAWARHWAGVLRDTAPLGGASSPATTPPETPRLVTDSSLPMEHFIREAAITWLAKETLLGQDSRSAENALAAARRFMDEYEHSEHFGDCTKQPQSCQRCICDEALAETRRDYNGDPAPAAVPVEPQPPGEYEVFSCTGGYGVVPQRRTPVEPQPAEEVSEPMAERRTDESLTPAPRETVAPADGRPPIGDGIGSLTAPVEPREQREAPRVPWHVDVDLRRAVADMKCECADDHARDLEAVFAERDAALREVQDLRGQADLVAPRSAALESLVVAVDLLMEAKPDEHGRADVKDALYAIQGAIGPARDAVGGASPSETKVSHDEQSSSSGATEDRGSLDPAGCNPERNPE
jgi:hypothetical protein